MSDKVLVGVVLFRLGEPLPSSVNRLRKQEHEGILKEYESD